MITEQSTSEASSRSAAAPTSEELQAVPPGSASYTSKGAYNRRQLLTSAASLSAVAAAAAVAVPKPAMAYDLWSVGVWEARFLLIWDRDHANSYLPKSLSSDSRVYYDLAYGVDAAAAMFQATGKTVYLDRALLYIDNILRSARLSSSFPASRFKDRYYGWVCRQSGRYYGHEVALYEIYLWRYVTRILRLMRANAGIWANSNYRAKFQQILNFTEVNIFEKWYARGPQWYVYREVTHITAHFGYMAIDLAGLTADATRRSRYMAVFNNINHALPNRPSCSLRKQLVRHPRASNGVFWHDYWGVFSRPGSDVPHANGVVSFIMEAHELGAEWTRADIDKLIATLKVIWPSGLLTNYYVDGTGSDTGWLNDGWCKLGRYDASLQQRFQTYKRAQTSQLWANCTLNAKFLASAA